MHKFILTAFILGLALILAVPSYAKEEEDPDRIVNSEVSRSHNKIQRGGINILTFPLEIFKQAKETSDEGDTLVKRAVLIVPGLFKGMSYAVLRLGSGIWDLATFNNFFYEEHEPIIKPDYVWENEEE